MFSKVWTSATLVLALCLQVNAHAAVSPALGVSGTPVRNDVKRPSTASPCGAGVNIASTIDSSTAVAANAAGTINADAINFNGGADGSRKFTAKVDSTGTGANFVAMTITTNGDAAPADVGSQPIVATLPAGTKCTGGATKNKCLVQFVSTAGFGNCVVVSQGAAGAAAGSAAAVGTAAAGAAAAGTAAAGTAAAGNTAAAGTAANASTKAGAAAGKAGAKKHGAKKQKAGKKAAAGGKKAAAGGKKAAAAGTRAARALVAELEARGEEAVQVVKRGLTSWIWA